MSSVIFSRCDGLDALLCMDPNYDKLLEDIDDQMTKPEELYDLVKESNYYAGLIQSEPINEESDDITEYEDYDYDCGNGDMIDLKADDIHDAMDICNDIGDMEVGDMIDQLMGMDYSIPDNVVEEV